MAMTMEMLQGALKVMREAEFVAQAAESTFNLARLHYEGVLAQPDPIDTAEAKRAARCLYQALADLKVASSAFTVAVQVAQRMQAIYKREHGQ